ncbi:MAG: ribonuclease P protein component [Candidatus Saccharibacteria bacterium]|nr:ribonuclease P protein component [Candidatus Saccharibacteria bacterium]
MISKAHRFHGYGSLKFVYKHGRVVRGPMCAIKYHKNPKRTTYRLAVVVSKKVNKSAVVRNRIRRRVFEVVRHYEDRVKHPYDIAIMVYSENVATMPHEELDTMLRTQLSQAGII